MPKQKRGISLIVLVITIIVMLILASAVVITLSNTNIITKAKEAVEKTNTANNMYLSEIKLAERKLEKVQGASKVKDTEAGVLRVENEGTENEIYYIESIDDLIAFSNSVNSGKTYENVTVILTQLLDFNSDKSYVDLTLKETVTTGEGFTPIGTDTNPFKGTFDGDGTEIRNLYIGNSELGYLGLFGVVADATIKNVGVTGRIENVSMHSAGIVACAMTENKSVNIMNCYSNVDISSSADGVLIAGIVADSGWGQENLEIIIQDCYNEGNISSDGENCYVGGVTSLASYANVNRCYNTGNISATGYNGMLGGIIADGYTSKIMNSYNIGTINGTDVIQGGLVGELLDSSKLYNSYNAGTVKSSARDYIAGLGGHTPGEDINNCFNFGIVTGQAELLYYINNTTVQNLYYISRGLPAIVSGTPTEEPIAKTLAEFNSQAFVDELNENIKDMPECVKWKLGENGYPVLDM